MYTLRFENSFTTTYKSLVKGNAQLAKRIEKALQLLKNEPFYPSLKSHKVNTRNFGEKWSSSATGDIRIIWDYDTEDRLVILLLDIGKHTGSHKVYK